MDSSFTFSMFGLRIFFVKFAPQLSTSILLFLRNKLIFIYEEMRDLKTRIRSVSILQKMKYYCKM